MTVTAKIAAASAKDTGITPELARQMWGQLGSHHLMIVEAVVDERTEDVEDAKAVKLVITSVEPATDPDTAEHLRELTRALYFARNPQPRLDDPDEDTTDTVVRRGKNTLTLLEADPD